MKIYTKQGDKLKTSIIKKRVFKDHDILETLGTIDEVMSYMMVVQHSVDEITVKDILHTVMKRFFLVSQDVLMDSKQITEEHVREVESWIDQFSEKLPPLDDFILPGETKEASMLHYLRTLIRRLERRMVHSSKKHPLHSALYAYINRLSDLIFVMARFVEM